MWTSNLIFDNLYSGIRLHELFHFLTTLIVDPWEAKRYGNRGTPLCTMMIGSSHSQAGALGNFSGPFLCEEPPRNVRGLPWVSDRKWCPWSANSHGGGAAGLRCTDSQAEGTRKSNCISERQNNQKWKKRAGGLDTELVWLKIQINYSSINLKAYRGAGEEIGRPWKFKPIPLWKCMSFSLISF